MRILSMHVDGRDKALKFYTEVVGFVKKHDFPALRLASAR
jgi:hypothetical protein